MPRPAPTIAAPGDGWSPRARAGEKIRTWAVALRDRDAATPQPGPATLLRDLVHDFACLPTAGNVESLAVGGTLAAVVHPIDGQVNRHLEGTGTVHAVFVPGGIIGTAAVEVGAAATTWLVGWGVGSGTVVRVGQELLRAQGVNGALTLGLKAAVRRERPDGSGRTSFPSGHASATFASATVLARHFGWRVAVPSYLVASYVAASRLHENRHYVSDVIFGATIGIVAGRTVTRSGPSRIAVVPVAMPGGVAVFFVG